jgi:hypothetical protein
MRPCFKLSPVTLPRQKKNRILVPFSMHNRTLRPYSTAIDRILFQIIFQR